MLHNNVFPHNSLFFRVLITRLIGKTLTVPMGYAVFLFLQNKRKKNNKKRLLKKFIKTSLIYFYCFQKVFFFLLQHAVYSAFVCFPRSCQRIASKACLIALTPPSRCLLASLLHLSLFFSLHKMQLTNKQEHLIKLHCLKALYILEKSN